MTIGERLGALPLDAERQHAELLLARGDLAAAEHLLSRLLGVYAFLGQSHLRGWAHVSLGQVHRQRREQHHAVIAHIEALRHLDRDLEPRLFDRAVHSLIALLESCDPIKTRYGRLLRGVRERRYASGTRSWDLHRWLEGVVLLLRSQYRRAAQTLNGARRRLLADGAIRDAGLATLHFVDACRAEGNGRAARLTVRDTRKTLERLGTDPELLIAFAHYADALEDGGDVDEARQRLRALLLERLSLAGLWYKSPPRRFDAGRARPPGPGIPQKGPP